MMRSRLFFLVLLLAYLGVTPAAVYTCACFIPGGPSLQQDQASLAVSATESSSETAVTAFLSYLSLSFLLALIGLVTAPKKQHRPYQPVWHDPTLFSSPPLTPPPCIA